MPVPAQVARAEYLGPRTGGLPISKIPERASSDGDLHRSVRLPR